MSSTVPSPRSQKQKKEMNASQCIQQQSLVRSCPSQFDGCADQSLVNCVPNPEDLTKQLSATGGCCLNKISKLIESEKWHALDLVLWSSSNDTTACADAPSDFGNAGDDVAVSSSLHIVHFACRFNPPRTIVKRLASMYPAGLTTPDKTGRLPLHHAAKWGASHRLIKCLIEMDPSAVSAKDAEGKTPIHHLCLHYVDAFRPNNYDVNVEDSMLQAIGVLLEADPSIVAVEDDLDATALEYAIESNAPYRVVRCLQRATGRFWKEHEKDGSSKKTDERSGVDTCPDHHNRDSEDGQHEIAALFATFNRIDASSSSDDGEETLNDRSNRATKLPKTTSGKQSSVRSKYAMRA
ncbi:hypothetical protein HJC23_000899 [Cyclotella cryptica]|uniref:Uncharacterized protein n=1 Tax=Cyclotella cryptica TaxID=29204 RepID=A0ABD3PTX5_9STRA